MQSCSARLRRGTASPQSSTMSSQLVYIPFILTLRLDPTRYPLHLVLFILVFYQHPESAGPATMSSSPANLSPATSPPPRVGVDGFRPADEPSQPTVLPSSTQWVTPHQDDEIRPATPREVALIREPVSSRRAQNRPRAQSASQALQPTPVNHDSLPTFAQSQVDNGHANPLHAHPVPEVRSHTSPEKLPIDQLPVCIRTTQMRHSYHLLLRSRHHHLQLEDQQPRPHISPPLRPKHRDHLVLT